MKITYTSKLKINNNSWEVDKMVSLKNSKEFLALLNSISWKIISLSLKSKEKVANRISLFNKFGQYLLVMNRRHGSLFVVKYLKASQLAIQKKVAGQPLKSLRELEPDLNLPRLSTSGLPVIIGTRDRRALCSDSSSIIQMYLSLFGIYRIITAESKPKLNTITDGYQGNEIFLKESKNWMSKNAYPILRDFGAFPIKLTIRKFNFIQKASPSCSTS